jgi:hypothetical protein
MFGILAGLMLFIGYNNKTAVANLTVNLIKGTTQALSNAFAPQITQSEVIVKEQVAEKRVVKQISQKVATATQQVANKIIPQARAATIPPAPTYIASTNNNYYQKPVSPQVSQYKPKRQNSKTTISLVSE